MKRKQQNHTLFRTTSVLAPMLFLGGALAMTFPAQAQVPVQGAAPAKPKSSGQIRDDFLYGQLSPRVAQDFEGALASIQPFLKANPNMMRGDKILVIAGASRKLYFNSPAPKRAAAAKVSLKLLDDALQAAETRDAGEPVYLSWETRILSAEKFPILVAEKRSAEASQVLDRVWPLMVSAPESIKVWGQNWRNFYNAQGQPQKAVDGLIQLFEQRALVQTRMYTSNEIAIMISDELLKQGKKEQALSWAKLAFRVSDYNPVSIREATGAVTRSLSAGELSVAKANTFIAAQGDISVPNPLEAVNVPQLDYREVEAQIVDPDSRLSQGARLNCLLLLGDYRAAMLLARDGLMRGVENNYNALQVARVFKAKDMNLVRANQFLLFYQKGEGEGENSIGGFLKETEPGASAKG